MFFSYFAWGIDDFGVSNAILLRGANSGQTFIKCCDQAYNVEPWLFLKNCKDLTMKLEVKYISPTSCSGRNFYIDQLPEGTGMRRILAQGIRIQKNPQSKQNIFSKIIMELLGSKVQLAPPDWNFINGVDNPEIVYTF